MALPGASREGRVPEINGGGDGLSRNGISACSKCPDIKYTDVAIIGNGPSGITLSYLLSGHWPYYSGTPHPNEYLQLRMAEGGEKSLIQQDLEFLSDGLEGRSSNPVALLFDTLTHPDADMGYENSSLLRWEHRKDRVIPHVVFGKGPPGGTWQMMEGKMQTLSLGNWMELPNLPFREWLNKRIRNFEGSSTHNRASMEDVRTYYTEYVKTQNLLPHFRPYTTVTSVERVVDVKHRVDGESGETIPCNRDHSGKFKWEVRVQEKSHDDESGEFVTKDLCYRTPNVVLATGSYDLPNKLRVPGEQLDYVMYSLADLERLASDGTLHSGSDPVAVIGAGLSAADAVIMARNFGIPVVHIFRRGADDKNIVMAKLPTKLYPEYHWVRNLMQEASEQEIDGYRSYPRHSIKECLEDGKLILREHKSDCDIIVQCSKVLCLIGSKPNLSFLSNEGKNLGLIPGKHIDGQDNPVDVDPYTYESNNAEGMFALGPLVGDNFVRFLKGGALGIASHLWSKRVSGK